MEADFEGNSWPANWPLYAILGAHHSHGDGYFALSLKSAVAFRIESTVDINLASNVKLSVLLEYS